MENSFGEWLRQRRRSLDLTQEELARRVGCSAITLRKLEAEARRPSKQIVERLADVLTVAPDERPAFLRFARGDPFAATALSQIADGLQRPQHLPLGAATGIAMTALDPRMNAKGGPGSSGPRPSPEANTSDILRALRSARLGPKHNLPTQLTSFIGREKEIADIKQRLQPGGAPHPRLVTLTGSGGTGKTRLALQVASELVPAFPDGVWFVEFAPIADPALVPQPVLAALGLREEKERPVQMMLADYVRDRTLLLLFDNCEHLIDACACLAEALLHAGPNVYILATSREALDMAGEAAVRIPSLSLPEAQTTQREILLRSEAGRLFVERAQTASPDFAANEDSVPAAVQVCRRLDGIPLAIELAAARVKTLRVEQIAARLDDRFRLLTGGSRTALPRQQTLRALIDWSYNLLTEPERTLLRRLSVFAGGWTLEAAQAVGGDEAEALELLAQLVNKSLVVAERQPGAEARYALLETIRQYACEKLAESGEGEPTRRQHLAYFLQLAQRAEPHFYDAGQTEWFQKIEDEHENIRAALEWSLQREVASGQQLALALWWAWKISGHASEGYQWLGRMLAATAGAETLTQAQLLSGWGWLAVEVGDFVSAQKHSEESVALFRQLGDEASAAFPLATLGWVFSNQPDFRKANRLLEESQALLRRAGNRWGLAHVLNMQGTTAEIEGNLAQAEQLYEEGLAISQEIGDREGQGWAAFTLGGLAETKGEFSRASELYSAALQIGKEVGSQPTIMFVLRALGRIAIHAGDYELAEASLEEAFELSRKMGAPNEESSLLLRLGRLAVRRKDYPRARALFAEGLQAVQRGGRHTDRASEGLISIGLFLFAQGLTETGVRLFGVTQSFTPGGSLCRFFPHERAEHDGLLASARAILGEEVYTTAWEAGRQMNLDEAVAYALKAL